MNQKSRLAISRTKMRTTLPGNTSRSYTQLLCLKLYAVRQKDQHKSTVGKTARRMLMKLTPLRVPCLQSCPTKSNSHLRERTRLSPIHPVCQLAEKHMLEHFYYSHAHILALWQTHTFSFNTQTHFFSHSLECKNILSTTDPFVS